MSSPGSAPLAAPSSSLLIPSLLVVPFVSVLALAVLLNWGR